MAKKINYTRNTKYTKRSKKSKYTEVERVAYLMGQVERGRKNPESRISDSYKKGCSEPAKRQKKSLF